jgi:hypothetical protein
MIVAFVEGLVELKHGASSGQDPSHTVSQVCIYKVELVDLYVLPLINASRWQK